MKFSRALSAAQRPAAHALIVPYFEESQGPATRKGDWDAIAKAPIALKDFEGKEGQLAVVYAEGLKESRLFLVGLGKAKELTQGGLRTAFAKAVLRAQGLSLQHLNVLLPPQGHGLKEREVVQSMAEGMQQANYRFDIHKTKKPKERKPSLISKVALVGMAAENLAVARREESIGAGATLAKDLINGNADDITPKALGAVAKRIAARHEKITAQVFNKQRIERDGMGLLLAVARGSENDPVFITLKYRGKPASREHTVLVGKAITYDTGGLNIKPTGSMEDMRTDMSAAAACLGTIESLAALGAPVNCTVVIASAENAVDGKSYKPGDVYKGYAGKSVEVVNTDAEGRLTLADALAYSVKNLKPSRIIDLATLTGSAVIALGEEMAFLVSNDDSLADELVRAGERVGELLWRMPLHRGYKKLLKSEIADLKNCGPRWGGAITAGLFLQEFVDSTPWAHLDIAGVAFPNKIQAGHSTLATGYGVRLLVELLSA